MKRIVIFLAIWLAPSICLFAGDISDTLDYNSFAVRGVQYQILEGSTLIDDCLDCNRPTYLVPIRGQFWLRKINTDPLFVNYAVGNLKFHSQINSASYKGVLNGTYRIGGEFALVHQMKLIGEINGNRLITLDSGMTLPSTPFPWIEIDLIQQDPLDPMHIYSIHLVAAPSPKLWFSTEVGFTPSCCNRKISDGDLLSPTGRIIQTNNQLTSRLGIMPIVPDIGLDAVMRGWPVLTAASIWNCREIWFSSEINKFSEDLGTLHAGDILSSRGYIVRSYNDLISPFGPMPPVADYGLDAVARGPQGQILFSIEQDFFSENLGVNIGQGDLLSDKGYVFRSSKDLLSEFIITGSVPKTFGLDAVFVWPHGEVWFSTESDFTDQRYGNIGNGDLLSSYGKVVMRNRELLNTFKPLEDLADFGLDAIEVLWPGYKADLNDDGVVDIVDYAILSSAYLSNANSSTWNADCDINAPDADNNIDALDITAFLDEWLLCSD